MPLIDLLKHILQLGHNGITALRKYPTLALGWLIAVLLVVWAVEVDWQQPFGSPGQTYFIFNLAALIAVLIALRWAFSGGVRSPQESGMHRWAVVAVIAVLAGAICTGARVPIKPIDLGRIIGSEAGTIATTPVKPSASATPNPIGLTIADLPQGWRRTEVPAEMDLSRLLGDIKVCDGTTVSLPLRTSVDVRSTTAFAPPFISNTGSGQPLANTVLRLDRSTASQYLSRVSSELQQCSVSDRHASDRPMPSTSIISQRCPINDPITLGEQRLRITLFGSKLTSGPIVLTVVRISDWLTGVVTISTYGNSILQEQDGDLVDTEACLATVRLNRYLRMASL